LAEQRAVIALILSPAALKSRFWPAVFAEDNADKWISRSTASIGARPWAVGLGALKSAADQQRQFYLRKVTVFNPAYP